MAGNKLLRSALRQMFPSFEGALSEIQGRTAHTNLEYSIGGREGESIDDIMPRLTGGQNSHAVVTHTDLDDMVFRDNRPAFVSHTHPFRAMTAPFFSSQDLHSMYSEKNPKKTDPSNPNLYMTVWGQRQGANKLYGTTPNEGALGMVRRLNSDRSGDYWPWVPEYLEDYSSWKRQAERMKDRYVKRIFQQLPDYLDEYNDPGGSLSSYFMNNSHIPLRELRRKGFVDYGNTVEDYPLKGDVGTFEDVYDELHKTLRNRKLLDYAYGGLVNG